MTIRVSVKGVVVVDGSILLLRNERDEWELPGGKLEHGEEPQDCCQREIREETALEARPDTLIDAWLYRIAPEGEVLILTYGCAPLDRTDFVISHEHSAGELFPPETIAGLPMPDGYKRSIAAWLERLDGTA